jgi:hypothetical protein
MQTQTSLTRVLGSYPKAVSSKLEDGVDRDD